MLIIETISWCIAENKYVAYYKLYRRIFSLPGILLIKLFKISKTLLGQYINNFFFFFLACRLYWTGQFIVRRRERHSAYWVGTQPHEAEIGILFHVCGRALSPRLLAAPHKYFLWAFNYLALFLHKKQNQRSVVVLYVFRVTSWQCPKFRTGSGGGRVVRALSKEACMRTDLCTPTGIEKCCGVWAKYMVVSAGFTLCADIIPVLKISSRVLLRSCFHHHASARVGL